MKHILVIIIAILVGLLVSLCMGQVKVDPVAVAVSVKPIAVRTVSPYQSCRIVVLVKDYQANPKLYDAMTAAMWNTDDIAWARQGWTYCNDGTNDLQIYEVNPDQMPKGFGTNSIAVAISSAKVDSTKVRSYITNCVADVDIAIGIVVKPVDEKPVDEKPVEPKEVVK